ncbi:MAG: HD domain-containing protein, partial [Pseudomonadota bacterium]
MIRAKDRPAQTELSRTELVGKLCAGFAPQQARLIENALDTALSANADLDRPRGIDVALILRKLKVDARTLQAALLTDPPLREALAEDFIREHYGESVATLVRNVNWLNTFNQYSPEIIKVPEQAETLRRMLLSMTSDVRAVLIKLAYRVRRLRILARQDSQLRRYIAQETMDIYAPLANRLGIGQLKWELEDLAFRYLEPDAYKKLVGSLAENRTNREAYIQDFVQRLTGTLESQGIVAKVHGRPKHIYSIWRKMQRKQVELDELFDLLAVRIIVDKISTCYEILGVVHSLWQYIPKEFDDYIANPKDNGYQSLHTVVIGPGGAKIEIQIRTREMHEFGELGVAAHWWYKEGGKQ